MTTSELRRPVACLAFSVLVHFLVLMQRIPGLESVQSPPSTATRVWLAVATGERAAGTLAGRAPGAAPPASEHYAVAVPAPMHPTSPPSAPHALEKRTNVRPPRAHERQPSANPPREREARPASDTSQNPAVASASPGPGSDLAAKRGSAEADAGGEGDGAGTGTGTARMARQDYEQVLAAWIERHKYYPLVARRRGVQGTSALKIALRRDGSVASTQLAGSSSYDVLDEAALDIVRRSAPFPPVPEQVRGSTFEFTVPIRFRLE